MDNVEIRGRRGSLHFIRFPTSEMGNFLTLAKAKGMAQLVTTVCATGGGAFKFEKDFKEQVNMKLAKFDELDALIKGLLFTEYNNLNECYYWENPADIMWVALYSMYLFLLSRRGQDSSVTDLWGVLKAHKDLLFGGDQIRGKENIVYLS